MRPWRASRPTSPRRPRIEAGLDVTGTALLAALAPEIVHGRLLEAARPALGFDPARPLPSPETLRAKLADLLRVPEGRCDLRVRIEDEGSGPGWRARRLLFAAEPDADVPAWLLLPEKGDGPFPLMICLQGHSAGMAVSLDKGDAKGRDFAVQAVERGFAALALELRGFGERRDARPASFRHERYAPASLDPDLSCRHAAMVALLLGRTSLGEKVLDVIRALDAAATLPEIDAARVHLIGHSGGGTLAWYAAAMDPRIRGLILSCCFSTYAASIGRVDHCADNYVPDALRWFDFPDLAMLIAPRPLVVVMGRDDGLFPMDGVRAAFAKTAAIFERAEAAHRCRLMVEEGGHRFYPETAWPAFLERLEA